MEQSLFRFGNIKILLLSLQDCGELPATAPGYDLPPQLRGAVVCTSSYEGHNYAYLSRMYGSYVRHRPILCICITAYAAMQCIRIKNTRSTRAAREHRGANMRHVRQHTPHATSPTESTQEFSSPLQLLLDTPGDDFCILDSSVTVEEMLACLQLPLGAGLFHVTPRYTGAHHPATHPNTPVMQGAHTRTPAPEHPNTLERN